MRANLARGTHARHELQLPKGFASVDHRQHAALEKRADGLALHVRNLLSAETVHRWPLPALAVNIRDARWGVRLLAMPYGAARQEETGLLLVNVSSGTCITYALPPARDQRIPFISRWSAAGLLLADHTSKDGENSVSVFDDDGQLVDCALVPGAEGFNTELDSDCWAPNGRSACVYAENGCVFYTWEVGVSKPVLHKVPDDFGVIAAIAWLRDCQRLLIFDSGGDVLVWSPDGTTVEHNGSFEWPPLVGSKARIALLTRPPAPHTGESYTYELHQLCFFTVQDSGFVCTGAVLHQPPPMAFAQHQLPAHSPDGAFAAVSSGPSSEGTSHSGDGLDMVSLDGAVQHQCLLPFSFSASISVQWSSAGDAVLVSDWSSGRHVLLEYA